MNLYDLGTTIDRNEYIDNPDLSWRNLSAVQIDFIEMGRQREKVSLLAEEASQRINQLSSAVSSLAALVGSSCQIDSTAIDTINKITTNIVDVMASQMNQMKALSDDVKAKLESMVSQLFTSVQAIDEDGNIIYDENGLVKYLRDEDGDIIKKSVNSFISADGEVVNYNDLLKRSELEKKNGYDINKLLNIVNSAEGANDYLEILGIDPNSDYETMIKTAVDIIKNSSNISGRGKAVNTAIVMNAILYDNKDGHLDYVLGAAHGNYSVDSILNASDCSSYTSFLIRQGQDDSFTGGWTGYLANNTVVLSSFSDMQPGDIVIVAPQNEDGHVRFYLGQDENGNYIFTENNGIKTITSYSEEQLTYSGYKPYHVSYADDYENVHDSSAIEL